MSDANQRPPGDINILVVDDDPDLCQLLSEILSEYAVDVLHDGHQVSAKLAGKDYQILISDLHMPSFTGLDLLEVLKPHYPDLEILLLTGGGSVETAVEAMKLGAAEFLLKPVRVAELREAIHRAEKRLEIGRENRMLRDIHSKRESLIELRESLVTLITHELRTPLTSLMFLNSELTRLQHELPKSMVPLLDIFRTSLGSLQLLAEDLRCLGEDNGSALSILVAPFDPIDLMQRTLSNLERHLTNRELTFAMENEDRFTWTGDERRVEQILSELLSNSVRATPDGGSIRIGAYRDGQELILEVVDTGVGIPRSKIPIIFEPFQTLRPLGEHHSSESAYLSSGLGIGLSMVKNLVERLNGTIGVVSDEGQGCIVEVRLPEFAQPFDGKPNAVPDEADFSLADEIEAQPEEVEVMAVDLTEEKAEEPEMESEGLESTLDELIRL